MKRGHWNRRQVLSAAGALSVVPIFSRAEERRMISRNIPSSNEELPVIGLGTYDVFDIASTQEAITSRRSIVDQLTGEGGSVIDTSPMYNRSEKMIGDIISAGSPRDALFLEAGFGALPDTATRQRMIQFMQSV